MYLVAAIAQEIGPPEPIPAHEPAAKPKMIPVGVRHAVPQPDRSFGSSYALVSLCGSDVAGMVPLPQHRVRSTSPGVLPAMRPARVDGGARRRGVVNAA